MEDAEIVRRFEAFRVAINKQHGRIKTLEEENEKLLNRVTKMESKNLSDNTKSDPINDFYNGLFKGKK